MDDPVRRHIFQPVVDTTGTRPRTAARHAADVFMAGAVTLTCLRASTLDWATTPGLAATLSMAIVGALILWALMRFCAATGPALITGPLGAVHMVIRGVLLYSVGADVLQVHGLVTAGTGVEPVSLLRALMQLAQNLAGLCAIYLALCDEPPPRRRRTHAKPATT